VLVIDARGLGHMVSRTNRELSAEDIGRIADTYHARRGEDADLKPYEDDPGFPYEDVPASAPRRISTRSATTITYSYPASTSAASPSRAMGNRRREDRSADCRHRRLVVPSAWPAAPT